MNRMTRIIVVVMALALVFGIAASYLLAFHESATVDSQARWRGQL